MNHTENRPPESASDTANSTSPMENEVATQGGDNAHAATIPDGEPTVAGTSAGAERDHSAAVVENSTEVTDAPAVVATAAETPATETASTESCLLYTSPSPRDKRQSRMPSSA